MTVAGVLLAGGRSMRMGGSEKSHALLDGKPLIAHVAERFAPQVDRLVVNANSDPANFADLGFSVVADADDRHDGPLAGMLAGFTWAHADVPDAPWLATVTTDTPFIPHDLVARLRAASEDTATIRLAASGGRIHQAIGLWPTALGDDLARWLRSGQPKAVRAWLDTLPYVTVDFSLRAGVDPFFNINTPEDLEKANVPFLESGR